MQEHQTVKAKVKVTKPVICVKKTVLGVRGQFQVFSKLKGTRLYNYPKKSQLFLSDRHKISYEKKKLILKYTSKILNQNCVNLFDNASKLGNPNSQHLQKTLEQKRTDYWSTKILILSTKYELQSIANPRVTCDSQGLHYKLLHQIVIFKPTAKILQFHSACIMAKLLFEVDNKQCYYFS